MEKIKTYRPTYEEYITKRDEIIRRKTSVEEWVRISMSKDTPVEEIVIRAMMNNDPTIPKSEAAREVHDEHIQNLKELGLPLSSNPDPTDYTNYICMTYLCSANTEMSDELIRDLIYINSGLMKPGCWDQRVIDWVFSLYDKLPQFRQKADMSEYIVPELSMYRTVDLPEDYFFWLESTYIQKIDAVWDSIVSLRKTIKSHKEVLEAAKYAGDQKTVVKYKKKIEDAKRSLNKRVTNKDTVTWYVTNRLDWPYLARYNSNVSNETLKRFFRAIPYDTNNEENLAI